MPSPLSRWVPVWLGLSFEEAARVSTRVCCWGQLLHMASPRPLPASASQHLISRVNIPVGQLLALAAVSGSGQPFHFLKGRS